MSEEEKEQVDEGNMQMEIDNQRENGYHNQRYGINCKCYDCQIENRSKEKELTKVPF